MGGRDGLRKGEGRERGWEREGGQHRWDKQTFHMAHILLQIGKVETLSGGVNY